MPRRVTAADRFKGHCACGDHAWALLSAGHVTIVEPDDAHLLAANVYSYGGNGYAVRRAEGRLRCLHHDIMGKLPGLEVDHEFHSLDNRRRLMRHCTHAENMANIHKRSPTHGFKGIYPRKGSWVATGRRAGRNHWIGTFPSREAAARAWDAWAKKHRGVFARPNFPEVT